MKRRLFLVFMVVLALLFFGEGRAQAGAKIKIDDESSIDLGFRLQSLFLMTDKDLDNDGDFEQSSDFKVRRARIRLNGKVNDMMSMFIQTEFAEEPGKPSADVRIIDAYTKLKFDDWAQVIVGENMAPVLRQNLTGSGALLTIDRPGIAYKSLAWGVRAQAAFTNTSVGALNPAVLVGKVDVRDMGATLFGSGKLAEAVHAKYYLGMYDGVQNAGSDSERFAGRVQVNLGDPEPDYYNSSTYLGKKNTIGIGASYDTQANVDKDVATGRPMDYKLYTADVFADRQVGPGALTLEGAYIKLDLDAVTIDKDPGAVVTNFDVRRAAGDGYYVQAGYLINKVQPWVGYETWKSDDPGDVGRFKLYRIGASYFMKGQNANIKAGYELFDAGWQLATNTDKIKTFTLGFFITY